MKYNKVIEMDIWSNFGCFTKPFSTTGGLLTYLIPPKTSIIGIIGSVLGYEFDDYTVGDDNKSHYSIEKLFDVKISIQPLFDLKTKRVTFNRVDGNINKLSISNIHQDVLINPYYKLFISFPESLKIEEEIFIERVKNHQTIYNLYMGRNEFVLSYEFYNIFDYDVTVITKDNAEEFFSNNNMKIFGTLNRSLIKDTKLKSIYKNNVMENSPIFSMNNQGGVNLSHSFEYIVPEYPIKRSNFTEFSYSEISFFACEEFKKYYFSQIQLKDDLDDDDSLDLIRIGENEWISMI